MITVVVGVVSFVVGAFVGKDNVEKYAKVVKEAVQKRFK